MQASRETAHPGDIRGELFAQTIEKQAKRLQKQDGIGLYEPYYGNNRARFIAFTTNLKPQECLVYRERT